MIMLRRHNYTYEQLQQGMFILVSLAALFNFEVRDLGLERAGVNLDPRERE